MLIMQRRKVFLHTGETRVASLSICLFTLPSKHDLSIQCWTNVGPTSWTVNQHWIDVSCLLGNKLIFRKGIYSHFYIIFGVHLYDFNPEDNIEWELVLKNAFEWPELE